MARRNALDIILTNLPVAVPSAPIPPATFRLIDSATAEITADFAPPVGTRYIYDILGTASLTPPVTWTTNLTIDIFWPADGLSFQVPIDPAATTGFFKIVPRQQ